MEKATATTEAEAPETTTTPAAEVEYDLDELQDVKELMKSLTGAEIKNPKSLLAALSKERNRAEAAERELAKKSPETPAPKTNAQTVKVTESKEFKSLSDEKAKLEAELTDYKVKDRKADALKKAKSNMGEGFVIPDEDGLATQAAKLSFNEETIDADIQALVDLVKREPAKTSQGFPIFGQPVKSDSKPTGAKTFKQMNAKERDALYKSNPDEYSRLRDAAHGLLRAA